MCFTAWGRGNWDPPIAFPLDKIKSLPTFVLVREAQIYVITGLKTTIASSFSSQLHTQTVFQNTDWWTFLIYVVKRIGSALADRKRVRRWERLTARACLRWHGISLDTGPPGTSPTVALRTPPCSHPAVQSLTQRVRVVRATMFTRLSFWKLPQRWTSHLADGWIKYLVMLH